MLRRPDPRRRLRGVVMPAGVQAWLTLTAALALAGARPRAARWVTAEVGWWLEQRRQDAEWRAVSEPAYLAELGAAAAERAVRDRERLARSASLAAEARALRPWTTTHGGNQ